MISSLSLVPVIGRSAQKTKRIIITSRDTSKDYRDFLTVRYMTSRNQ